MVAKFVDDGGRIVLLFHRGDASTLIKDQGLLGSRSLLPFTSLGDRRDVLCDTASLDGLLRWLPFSIQLPVPGWTLVRGIKDGVLKERIFHVWTARPYLTIKSSYIERSLMYLATA